MKMIKKSATSFAPLLLATMLFVMGFSVTSEAALSGRDLDGNFANGFEAFYDTDINITWLKDANLFQTMAAANPGLVSEIIALTPKVGNHTLMASEFITSNGRMTLYGTPAWTAYLNSIQYEGITGWRLPTTDPAVTGYNQTGSEMGHMFYVELGGTARQSIATAHANADNYNLFSNIQAYAYWSGTTSPVNGLGYDFAFLNGNQLLASLPTYTFNAWIVHDGDIGSAAPVPIPAAAWLLGSGLMGLVGMRRRFFGA